MASTPMNIGGLCNVYFGGDARHWGGSPFAWTWQNQVKGRAKRRRHLSLCVHVGKGTQKSTWVLWYQYII